MDDTTVVVIGGGVAGCAAAYALAGRGVPVTLLERFEFGHLRGSSGGPTRIFRFAYSEERYARLAGTAREVWSELELASGESFLATTGGVDIGPHSADVAGTLDRIGREYTWLDSRDASANTARLFRRREFP